MPFPNFKNAEEAQFWEMHSPLDYPEFFEPCEVWYLDSKGNWQLALTGILYRSDLGNLPLPFSLTQCNFQEPNPSSSPSLSDENI